jgi:hypothetical protein
MSAQVQAGAVTADEALTAEGFDWALRTVLDKEISIYPARAWYPSSLGHPCDRFLVWNFTRWQDKARHDAVLQSIFDEGREHQPLIYKRLEQMGFAIIRESDRPTQYKLKDGAVISGRPDGRLAAFKGQAYKPTPILEAKTMSSFQWDKTHTVEDLKSSPYPWTRSYYAQGHLYCFLENTPLGLFVLKNKTTGMLKGLPYELDFAFAESLLTRVERRLAPMVAQGVDPDPIPFDPIVCGGCAFEAQCYPPRDFGPGTQVLEDPALVEQLEVRERLKPASDEYQELDRTVKAILKRNGIKMAIAGPFQIELTERGVKEYTVPARTDLVVSIKRTG